MSNIETEFELDVSNKAERRTLRLVLVINLSQAALAGIVGFFADSTGLMGAALDNLADAGVYIVSLYAVGRSALAKSRAAYLSGTLLIILGLGLLIEVVRRFVAGGEPAGILMIVTAIINALSNLFCIKLLSSHKDKGAHMKASMVFTGNDMIVNLGIVVSGIMVIVFNSPLPDLVIGLIVVGISIKGGIEILREANEKL